MKILNSERGSGKTTALVNACYLGDKALVVAHSGMRTSLRKENPLANKIDIFTVEEVMSGCLNGRYDSDVYVDEIDFVLYVLLGKYNANLIGGTITV